MHTVSLLSTIVITYLCILHRCRCVDSDYEADTSDEYSVNDERRVSMPKNVENAVLTFPLQHFLSEGHGHALQGEFSAADDANSIPEEVLQEIVSNIINNHKRIFRISVMNERSTKSAHPRVSNQYGAQFESFDRPIQNRYLGEGLKNFAAFVTKSFKNGKSVPQQMQRQRQRLPAKPVLLTVNGNQIENRKTRKRTTKIIVGGGEMYKFYEPIFGYRKANNVQATANIDLYDLLTNLPMYEGPIEKLEEMHIFSHNY